ncbi:DUF1214 domain-containing protein [Aliiruegeria sabulilitoris]|uniref:DUF1214 domain-containing protein n=1 Tax=Aliiruegeria sabulilitoris TaxID=1510458 RepID=UPI0009E8033B|nr:DUF1214 domain-containing protein [Aliiruegeria sabulilitoris]NDR58876.1 DUF1214 domain-containing protein [Pseudoruegeria sp. M32A2M]
MLGARDRAPLQCRLETGIWTHGCGSLPEKEAFYIGIEPQLRVGEYKIDVPAKVPVEAFWSVSLHNADGVFEPNAIWSYNINSITGKRNNDGSMTVHLGGCDDGRVNCLPSMDRWNYTVRLYRPMPEVLDGPGPSPLRSRPVDRKGHVDESPSDTRAFRSKPRFCRGNHARHAGSGGERQHVRCVRCRQ